MGRPKKYTDKWIERMAVKLLQYAQEYPLPLKQDFASQNKFASEMMSRFASGNDIFHQALKRFEDIQQKKIIGAAMLNKINTTFAIFTLKNVAGWRDVIEQKGGSTTNIHITPKETYVFKDADPEEIERANGKNRLHAQEGSTGN